MVIKINKKGQFFLIAAIIIVGLIVGLSTAVNFVNVGNNEEAFYDLALKEVGPETKAVLDYGVFNEGVELAPLVRGFLENYTSYIGSEEVLFVYGDSDNLDALYFDVTEGRVGINTGGGLPEQVTIQYTTGDVAHITREGNRVNVMIEDVNYEFDLREGQNFFFVIRRENNGETFVAKGE